MTSDCQKTKNDENGKEFMNSHFVVLAYDFVKIMRIVAFTYDKIMAAVGIEF